MKKARLIEKHLLENGSITSWEAIQNYRATRLSAIIFNLRKRYEIDTVMVENEEGIQYARYYMRGENNTNAIVSVRNYPEYIKLLEFLEADGVIWINGNKPTKYRGCYWPIDSLHIDGKTLTYISNHSEFESALRRNPDATLFSSVLQYITYREYEEEGEKNMKVKFTKSDLKTGMIVEVRNGWKYMYLQECDKFV